MLPDIGRAALSTAEVLAEIRTATKELEARVRELRETLVGHKVKLQTLSSEATEAGRWAKAATVDFQAVAQSLKLRLLGWAMLLVILVSGSFLPWILWERSETRQLEEKLTASREAEKKAESDFAQLVQALGTATPAEKKVLERSRLRNNPAAGTGH